MNLRRLLAGFAFALVARSTAEAQSAESVVAGCYSVVRDAWPATLGGDSVLHRIPPRIRLDSASIDRRGRRLSPGIAYPSGNHGIAARWSFRGDSISLLWSNGFSPTRVIVASRGLTGMAIAQNDHSPPESHPRVWIQLRRDTCEDDRRDGPDGSPGDQLASSEVRSAQQSNRGF